MHGFMNFNLYRPKKVFGFVVPWEGVISSVNDERDLSKNFCDYFILFMF